jgi:glyoxylase-like metal-dependent hydrolase (beta-lactamase superfamily II)
MIQQMPIGLLGSNCYLIVDDESSEAAIVDPGFVDPEHIRRVILNLHAQVRYILNTHGHFDHVAGNGTFEIPPALLGIHPEDRSLLRDGGGATLFGLEIPPSPKPDLDLVDGCSLALGDRQFTVMHTPGHTPGSICLLVSPDQALLTGDTLFRGGVGRTDLPGGNNKALHASLGRIARLPLETRIYPGHGGASTIRQELLTNPWLHEFKSGQ